MWHGLLHPQQSTAELKYKISQPQRVLDSSEQHRKNVGNTLHRSNHAVQYRSGMKLCSIYRPILALRIANIFYCLEGTSVIKFFILFPMFNVNRHKTKIRIGPTPLSCSSTESSTLTPFPLGIWTQTTTLTLTTSPLQHHSRSIPVTTISLHYIPIPASLAAGRLSHHNSSRRYPGVPTHNPWLNLTSFIKKPN